MGVGVFQGEGIRVDEHARYSKVDLGWKSHKGNLWRFLVRDAWLDGSEAMFGAGPGGGAAHAEDVGHCGDGGIDFLESVSFGDISIPSDWT